jgi:hypothetical protein
MIDTNASVLLWSDPTYNCIKFLRFHINLPGFRYPSKDFDIALQYDNFRLNLTSDVMYTSSPIGIALDDGFGKILWNTSKIVDCYGHGICTENEGSLVCQCDKDYYGDCQAKICPTGLAWYDYYYHYYMKLHII